MSYITRQKKKKIKRTRYAYLLGKNTPFAVSEAYKTLRTNLSFTVRGHGCKVIEITSSIQGEGKSTTSVNLAISLADSGAKVLLIDCDLRVPSDAAKLGIKTDFGLSDVLVGTASWQDAMVTCAQGMDFLSSGRIPPNPSELISSQEMHSLLDQLKCVYDYILLDAPPVTVVTDAALLSQQATGVLMVVQHDSSDRDLVNKAVQTLEFASATILGFVYTRAVTGKKKKSKYYGYGYTYTSASGNVNNAANANSAGSQKS